MLPIYRTGGSIILGPKGEMGTNRVVLTHAVHGNDIAKFVSDDDQKK